MKLDKLKFAQVVGWCANNGMSVGQYEIDHLDELIDIEVPAPKESVVPGVAVESLMKLMAEGERKIEAIKAYRILTGEGLKESKDAVERHWQAARPAATLGDLLGKALNKKTAKQLMLEHLDDIPDGSMMKDFDNSTISYIRDFIKSFHED